MPGGENTVLDAASARHLLRRSGFGAPPDAVAPPGASPARPGHCPRLAMDRRRLNGKGCSTPILAASE